MDCWPTSRELHNGAVVVVSSIAAAQAALVADESHLLVDSRTARQREIIAGRTMARHAMLLLGAPPAPVLMDSNGAPRWPIGFCGSIAHGPLHVAVVMAPTPAMQSLGVDIEDGRNLGAAAANVASKEDLEAVLSLDQTLGVDAAARWVFSAKEAVFKCQAPVTGDLDLDFDAVTLRSRQQGTLEARISTRPVRIGSEAPAPCRLIFLEIQKVRVAVATLP